MARDVDVFARPCLCDNQACPYCGPRLRAVPVHYEVVIKVAREAPAEARARAIEEGIGYACALLLDEYGRTADEVASLLERVTDDVQDREAS